MKALKNKKIVLGICGGISAYKSIELLRHLRRAQATVRVILTQSATNFVNQYTLSVLSQNKTAVDMFDEHSVEHINLASWADLIVVAPTTANSLAKFRNGMADNLLSATILATKAPIVLALAMNENMYTNVATKENLAVLRQRGFNIMPPHEGYLAEGINAMGRMAEPDDIANRVNIASIIKEIQSVSDASRASSSVSGLGSGLGNNLKNGSASSLKNSLEGVRVLICAGSTREYIDPIRFISNEATGLIGVQLAHALECFGCQSVTMLMPPWNNRVPEHLACHSVRTAQDIQDHISEHKADYDIFVMAAAVGDFKAQFFSAQKIKKGKNRSHNLELSINPDIVRWLSANKSGQQLLVSFAAETNDVLENARQKMRAKPADLLVANLISTEHGTGAKEAQAYFLEQSGSEQALPSISKAELAVHIVERIAKLWAKI